MKEYDLSRLFDLIAVLLLVIKERALGNSVKILGDNLVVYGLVGDEGTRVVCELTGFGKFRKRITRIAKDLTDNRDSVLQNLREGYSLYDVRNDIGRAVTFTMFHVLRTLLQEGGSEVYRSTDGLYLREEDYARLEGALYTLYGINGNFYDELATKISLKYETPGSFYRFLYNGLKNRRVIRELDTEELLVRLLPMFSLAAFTFTMKGLGPECETIMGLVKNNGNNLKSEFDKHLKLDEDTSTRFYELNRFVYELSTICYSWSGYKVVDPLVNTARYIGKRVKASVRKLRKEYLEEKGGAEDTFDNAIAHIVANPLSDLIGLNSIDYLSEPETAVWPLIGDSFADLYAMRRNPFSAYRMGEALKKEVEVHSDGDITSLQTLPFLNVSTLGTRKTLFKDMSFVDLQKAVSVILNTIVRDDINEEVVVYLLSIAMMLRVNSINYSDKEKLEMANYIDTVVFSIILHWYSSGNAFTVRGSNSNIVKRLSYSRYIITKVLVDYCYSVQAVFKESSSGDTDHLCSSVMLSIIDQLEIKVCFDKDDKVTTIGKEIYQTLCGPVVMAPGKVNNGYASILNFWLAYEYFDKKVYSDLLATISDDKELIKKITNSIIIATTNESELSYDGDNLRLDVGEGLVSEYEVLDKICIDCSETLKFIIKGLFPIDMIYYYLGGAADASRRKLSAISTLHVDSDNIQGEKIHSLIEHVFPKFT